MDLSNAFVTLYYKILFDQLQNYGISLMVQKLPDPKTPTPIHPPLPTPTTITTGVAQGSIMGALLFMIYTNDTPLASNLIKFILCADDTAVFGAIDYSLSQDISAFSELVNRELFCVGEWLMVDRLPTNI